MHDVLTPDDFAKAAHNFIQISERIDDNWKIEYNPVDLYKTYLIKDTYINHGHKDHSVLLRAQFVIYYNLSYGVPAFSFNIWNSSGVLLTLDDVREMALVQINQKDFYSMITQQEHPLFQRPYFIMHPCHTEELLSQFKDNSKNIIVTFLGLITPLIRINLPFEYGL